MSPVETIETWRSSVVITDSSSCAESPPAKSLSTEPVWLPSDTTPFTPSSPLLEKASEEPNSRGSRHASPEPTEGPPESAFMLASPPEQMNGNADYILEANYFVYMRRARMTC